MEAKCPNNPEHNKFRTVHHVAIDAIFDGSGKYLYPADNDVGESIAGPNAGNQWNCDICGAKAEVTDG